MLAFLWLIYMYTVDIVQNRKYLSIVVYAYEVVGPEGAGRPKYLAAEVFL